MTTLQQKLAALGAAMAALFTAAEAGDEKIEPGEFVVWGPGVETGQCIANIDGKPLMLRYRGAAPLGPSA